MHFALVPTINDKIHCQTAENGVVVEATSNWKLFKRAYGEVEDNIIIYIERLKT